MKKYTMETLVGVFVLAGVLCVAYLTIKLGKLELMAGDFYHLTAKFSNAGGLRAGSSIELAGVEVGKVESIVLDPERYQAVVTLKVRKDVKLSDDSTAAVRTSGLIGDKYLKLTPGGSDDYLADGSAITDTLPPIDLMELVSKYAFGSVKDGDSKDKKE